MKDLIYTCKVLRKDTSNWVGFLGAIPVIFLVMIIVNLFIGENKLPSFFKDTNSYFFIGLVISGVAVAYVYFKGQLDLEIYKSSTGISIEVLDNKLITPLIVQSPFTMSKQWYEKETGQRGVKMKELVLTIIDRNNQPALTIISVLGALHDAPYGWEHINLFSTEASDKLIKAEHSYTNGKAEEISLELNSLLAVH